MEENKADNSLEENSLESTEGGSPAPDTGSESKSNDKKPEEKKKKRGMGGLKGLASRVNIYLLLFILIIVLAGFVVFIGLQRSKKDLGTATVTTTPLTQETLDQLNGTDASVGDNYTPSHF